MPTKGTSVFSGKRESCAASPVWAESYLLAPWFDPSLWQFSWSFRRWLRPSRTGSWLKYLPFFLLCCHMLSPNRAAESKPHLHSWKFSSEFPFYSLDQILSSGISLQACGYQRTEIWMPTAEPQVCWYPACFWLIPSPGPLSAAVFLLALSPCKLVSAGFNSLIYPQTSLWQKGWPF